MTEYLSTEQIAQRLNVCKRTVHNWVQGKNIPCLKMSPRLFRYDWQAILKAVQSLPSPEEIDKRAIATVKESQGRGMI